MVAAAADNRAAAGFAAAALAAAMLINAPVAKADLVRQAALRLGCREGALHTCLAMLLDAPAALASAACRSLQAFAAERRAASVYIYVQTNWSH